MRLLFSPVVCKLMAACTLLRGVTGFKLVFQSKYLRMDIAACVAHVLIQFQVQKRKLLNGPSVSTEFSILKNNY